MNYPCPKKKTQGVNKIHNKSNNDRINYSNRGDALEDDINATNEYYLLNDVAVIHKKPTPITIVKVDYPKRSSAKITEAYFKLPSTTDYNGIYKGKYIDFEVKQTQALTSFPFKSFHPHQITHLKKVLEHGAVAFVIIRLCKFEEDYLIMAKDFLDYYFATDRKSVPFEWIRDHGRLIRKSYIKPCDYLNALDESCL